MATHPLSPLPEGQRIAAASGGGNRPRRRSQASGAPAAAPSRPAQAEPSLRLN